MLGDFAFGFKLIGYARVNAGIQTQDLRIIGELLYPCAQGQGINPVRLNRWECSSARQRFRCRHHLLMDRPSRW